MSQTRSNNTKNALETTGQVLKTATLSGMVATTAYRCIQSLRSIPVDGDIKGAIKDEFSLVSSATSASAIALSAGKLLGTLVRESRNLSLRQGIAIFAVCLPAVSGAVYSMVNFGVEHNTGSSGYSVIS